MWYILLLLMIISVVWYLSSSGRSIREAQQNRSSGSDCWQLGHELNLKYQELEIRTTIRGCKDVLMESWREEEYAYLGAEQMTILEARAGPNQRLVKSFGIDNAFTTIDEGYHQDFKSKINKALKTSDADWLNLWNSTTKVAYKYIAKQSWTANILLVPLVQNVVFKAVMLKFFPDISKLDEDVAIANITRLINTIWMDSKRSPKLGSKSEHLSSKTNAFTRTFKRRPSMDIGTENLAALMKSLACVLPTNGQQTPRQNPLNIILPAYETLWRVVLHLIIEILFRHEDKNCPWKACLMGLAQNLDGEEKFSLHTNVDGRLCVLDIVNEGLRLYPPTKRIYRWEQRENQHRCLYEHPDTCAADIEAVQRDDEVWGPNALQFDPERWSRYSADERKRAMESFIPFGYGSLSCPAKGNFAPKMIGLLVAALMKEIDGQFELLATLEKDCIDGTEPLRTERNSYETLELKRLEEDPM